MAIFRFFKVAAAAILGFQNFKFFTVGRLRRVEVRSRVKFGRNRSNRGRDMAIFQFFKTAAAAILNFLNYYYILGPWRDRRNFLLFYMCQLWALHVFIELQFVLHLCLQFFYWMLKIYTPWVKKGCHPNHGYNFVNSWSIFKILSLLQTAVNFQQNLYYVTHRTLRILLHYLGKLKN